MKKLCIIAILFIIMAFSVMAQKSPAINISLLNQDPDPVDPGRYVELRFKIFNNMADTTAEDFQVMLEPEYPFTLDTNEEALRSLGNLQATGNSKNAVIVKYKVRVDDRAVEGSNPIRIKYKHSKTDWVSQEINVEVRTQDANLGISSVETTPKNIKPGDQATVKVTVKNMADSPMHDITMKLDLTFSEFLAKTTITAADSIVAFNAMPFAPLGSATEQKIYMLGPKEEATFTYNLIAYSDAVSKVYKVPIGLTYFDESGTEYTKNDIIGLIVGAKPDMSVIIDENDLYVGKNTGTVTIKIINKGFTDIKFLDIKTDHTDNLEVLSPHEVYIGNVDSDDYETADFKVFLKDGNKKEEQLDFPITVEYRDANNNLYSDTYNLKLEILNASKLGMQTGNSSWVVIVLIAVVVIGFLIYRRRNRKK
jgi:hypothetical protein